MIIKLHRSGQISVTLIKHSVSEHGDAIATFELEYPRFIHSELMTHRMFSRNAMSSRAVPVQKMIDQVRTDPAIPIHWGKNQSGMQAKEECDNVVLDNRGQEFSIREWWDLSAQESAASAEAMSDAGYHKQVVNRILEPFQRMKTVVTATEWDNFFYLRCHEDAQPEIKALAELMRDCLEESTPNILKSGQWHIPYVQERSSGFYLETEDYTAELSLEDALKVSGSCCAQASYRSLDDSLEKAIRIYDKLIESKPEHSSPFEHQACVMEDSKYQGVDPWEEGVTHMDANRNFWSANFKGWIQYRHLL